MAILSEGDLFYLATYITYADGFPPTLADTTTQANVTLREGGVLVPCDL